MDAVTGCADIVTASAVESFIVGRRRNAEEPHSDHGGINEGFIFVMLPLVPTDSRCQFLACRSRMGGRLDDHGSRHAGRNNERLIWHQQPRARGRR